MFTNFQLHFVLFSEPGYDGKTVSNEGLCFKGSERNRSPTALLRFDEGESFLLLKL